MENQTLGWRLGLETSAVGLMGAGALQMDDTETLGYHSHWMDLEDHSALLGGVADVRAGPAH